MYCRNCGIYHEKDQKQCRICHATLVGGQAEDRARIFVDLTQVPLVALLRSVKKVNPALAFFIFPFITVIYFFKKAFHKPFLSPFLNSRTQKYRVTQINETSGAYKGSYKAAITFLERNGFKPLIDLEDVNLSQVMLRKIMINSAQKVYGTLNIQKGTGRVAHITFHAVTSQKTYVEVNNEYGFPLRYPKNCMIQYLPGLSMEAAYHTFLNIFKEIGEQPIAVPLKSLMPINHKITQYSIDQGLRQGMFQIKTPPKPLRFGQTATLHMCSFHPLNAAVRKCSICNTPVCEACYTTKDGQYYCDHCLAETTVEEPPLLSGVLKSTHGVKMPEGFYFAGLGMRLLATLLDLVFIGLLTTGVYYGVRVITGDGSRTFPFIMAQFFGVAFTIWYFIILPAKFGQTVGKKILGLRIIDLTGFQPDKAAAIVRFGYHILSGLFIFPVLGYFFILFKKTRQGLHDRLAETFVITRSPKWKAILSWCLLAVPLIVGGWYFIPDVYSLLTLDDSSEIILEKKWSFPLDTPESYVNSARIVDHQCIVSTPLSLTALDIYSGDKVWGKADLADSTIYSMGKDHDSLLIVKNSGEEKALLALVHTTSGSITWKQNLDIIDPVVVADSKSIIVYGLQLIREYSPDGRLLWKRQFSEPGAELYAILNKDILVNIYTASSHSFMYLARHTGDILWEIKEARYGIGPNLGKGYQLFYFDDGQCGLMHLPEQKVLWQSPENIYHPAYDVDVAPESDDLPSYLYTTRSVIHTKDGSAFLKYPEGSHLICITNDFLIVSPHQFTGLTQTPQIDMLLLDKSAGLLKKQFPATNWISLRYIMENASDIYLLAGTRVKKSMTGELVIIHKDTFDMRRIPIGKNVYSPVNLTVFPRTNTVFIQTYKDVGLYALPEQSEAL
ncbi:MAG: RDD family protein [Deltaproteobacteria bacterium]|nr:RDD family protein [Deltaproteobacteria bacterium]